MSELHERIRYARTRAGLSQEELGGCCDPPVSKSAANQWERKKPPKNRRRAKPSLNNLKSISQVTGAPMEWLLSDEAKANIETDEGWQYEGTAISELKTTYSSRSSRQNSNNARPAILDKKEWQDYYNQLNDDDLQTVIAVIEMAIRGSSPPNQDSHILGRDPDTPTGSDQAKRTTKKKGK